jgi:lipopolysaccharide export system permease protein
VLVPLNILQRYVVFDVLRAFLMVLTAATAVFVLFMIMAEAARLGLTPRDILILIPYVVPGTLPFTVPVSLLLAVTVVYGRLAGDNEIVAIKSAGLSVWAVLWPSIHLAIILSGLLWFFSGYAIPRATHEAKLVLFKSVEDMFYKFLKHDGEFNNPMLPFFVKAQDVDIESRTMTKATFKHRAPTVPGKPPSFDGVITAEKAKVRFDIPHGLVRVFLDGAEVSRLSGNKGDVALLKDQVPEFPLPKDTPLNPEKTIQEWTTAELAEQQKEYAKKLSQEKKRQALLTGLWIASGRPYQYPKGGGVDWGPGPWKRSLAADWGQVQQILINYEFWEQKWNAFQTEWWQRMAMAWGSLCFVLLGAPLGIWFARRDFLSAFITCFVPIITLYYPIMLLAINLAKEGMVPAGVALWSGNILLFVMAIPVLIVINRH